MADDQKTLALLRGEGAKNRLFTSKLRRQKEEEGMVAPSEVDIEVKDQPRQEVIPTLN